MSCISKGTIKSRKSNAVISYTIGDKVKASPSPAGRMKPLVFIDVNLGKEKGKQKLTIYKNDNPKEVALKFAAEHSKCCNS